MEGTHWYHAEEGKALGPLSEAQLLALLKLGKVTGETLVWKPGADDWKKLSLVQHEFVKTPELVLNDSKTPISTETRQTEPTKGLWSRLFGRS